MVTTSAAQLPETPAGNPVTEAPVAPVVAKVMAVRAVLIHLVWLLVPAPELSVMVLSDVTKTSVAAEVAEHPFPSVAVTVYEPLVDAE